MLLFIPVWLKHQNLRHELTAGVSDELLTFQYFVMKDGVEVPRFQQIQKVPKIPKIFKMFQDPKGSKNIQFDRILSFPSAGGGCFHRHNAIDERKREMGAGQCDHQVGRTFFLHFNANLRNPN